MLNNSNNSLEQDIFISRIKLLFAKYAIGFYNALAVAIVTLIVLWGIVEPRHLIAWFSAMLMLLLIRYYLVYRAKKSDEPQSYRVWYRYYQIYLVTALLLGLVWGLLGTVLFPEENDAYQAFVLIILTGISAGALPLMFQVKEVFVAFVVPIILPFTINLLFEQEKAYLGISFLAVFYFVGMYLVARRGEHGVIESIKLGFENRDLIKELEQAQTHLLAAKDELELRVEERTSKLIMVSNELSRQKEMAETTLSSIADGIITTNERGEIQNMNASAEVLTGYKQAEVIGMDGAKCIRLIDDEENAPFENPIHIALQEKRAINNLPPFLLVRKNNSTIAIKESIAPIFNPAGDVLGAVIVLHNVNNERLYRLQLAHQARHDVLTGIYNRFAFEVSLKKLLHDTRHQSHQHAVVYIDLDDFKIVNDTCGHAAGDELLRQLSLIMPQYLQTQDMFARLGGDEFGIIIANTDRQQAKQVCEQILKQIREYRFIWQNKTFNVGASIGLFIFSAKSQTLETIMSAADIACFTAKELGRNRIHIYSREDQGLATRRIELDWVNKIRESIEEDRLLLYSHPIIATNDVTGPIKHIEVLIRMLDDNDVLVSPGPFISAAERYHLMPQVDRWVVNKILEYYEDGRLDIGNDGYIIALNLSGVSLVDDELLLYIEQRIKQSNIRPECICFEITETAAIANLSVAIRFISKMRKLGCKFAIDDFGSGVSSLSYLKNLPVDYVKIDGSFVRDMVNDPVDYAMVESIHKLVALNGKLSIAEYVESELIMDNLKDIGVDYMQGFAIALPEPLLKVH